MEIVLIVLRETLCEEFKMADTYRISINMPYDSNYVIICVQNTGCYIFSSYNYPIQIRSLIKQCPLLSPQKPKVYVTD